MKKLSFLYLILLFNSHVFATIVEIDPYHYLLREKTLSKIKNNILYQPIQTPLNKDFKFQTSVKNFIKPDRIFIAAKNCKGSTNYFLFENDQEICVLIEDIHKGYCEAIEWYFYDDYYKPLTMQEYEEEFVFLIENEKKQMNLKDSDRLVLFFHEMIYKLLRLNNDPEKIQVKMTNFVESISKKLKLKTELENHFKEVVSLAVVCKHIQVFSERFARAWSGE